MPRFRSFFATAAIISTVAISPFTVRPLSAEEKDLDRLTEAAAVFSEIMEAPDKGIPTDLLRDAHAIAVIPDMVKAGLVFGGRRGEGLISVKGADGTWSNPSFVTLTGGSVGFQAGISSTDVILVFRTQRGVDSIVNGKFTLGADASAAAGPVGRTATAATDSQMKAEIYSYSRSRGLFAGVSLAGSTIRADRDANERIYGVGYSTRNIVMERKVEPTAAAEAWLKLLNEKM